MWECPYGRPYWLSLKYGDGVVHHVVRHMYGFKFVSRYESV